MILADQKLSHRGRATIVRNQKTSSVDSDHGPWHQAVDDELEALLAPSEFGRPTVVVVAPPLARLSAASPIPSVLERGWCPILSRNVKVDPERVTATARSGSLGFAVLDAVPTHTTVELSARAGGINLVAMVPPSDYYEKGTPFKCGNDILGTAVWGAAAFCHHNNRIFPMSGRVVVRLEGPTVHVTCVMGGGVRYHAAFQSVPKGYRVAVGMWSESTVTIRSVAPDAWGGVIDVLVRFAMCRLTQVVVRRSYAVRTITDRWSGFVDRCGVGKVRALRCAEVRRREGLVAEESRASVGVVCAWEGMLRRSLEQTAQHEHTLGSAVIRSKALTADEVIARRVLLESMQSKLLSV